MQISTVSNQPPVQLVTRALSLGIKCLRHKADHSPPSSAEVNNGGAILPLCHMPSWCGVSLIKHTENFIFLTLN
jgi:hypothetical protein